jgi:hypothetical protein
MTHALAKIGLAAVSVVLWPAAAGAAVTPYGHSAGAGTGSGNGSHNRNSFIINSPSSSHDFQHIRNVNISGTTVTPAAVCKRPVRHCRIIQKVVVYPPWG